MKKFPKLVDPQPPKIDYGMTNAELSEVIRRTQHTIMQTSPNFDGGSIYKMHVEHLRDLLIFERARAGAAVHP